MITKINIDDFFNSYRYLNTNTTSLDSIFSWIKNKNDNLKVNIIKKEKLDGSFWFYDKNDGVIKNKKNSFFNITGFKYGNKEQPIIIQNEIGFLGIICKKIDGILHFLMQAKIEPGNINKIQISPTIQATKSNFSQLHGGKKPTYFEYFKNFNMYEVIVDQIQSEQSSRFLGKRNRNIIIYVDEEIELYESHKWMTIGQIKKLMKIDNLVNMDTRTVMSCIPFSLYKPTKKTRDIFKDKTLYNSFFNDDFFNIKDIYSYINDLKMFQNYEKKIVPIYELADWNFAPYELYDNKSSFKVIFCDIEIEGREVTKWQQPLFEANGLATFALITTVYRNKRLFLVKIQEEIGCFDICEIGPTIQKESNEDKIIDEIEKLFYELYELKQGILYDVILSEEGGRFYHEQNKNIILDVPYEKLKTLPKGYFFLDYKTLNYLVQINNTLNIQLRNLLALLEV